MESSYCIESAQVFFLPVTIISAFLLPFSVAALTDNQVFEVECTNIHSTCFTLSTDDVLQGPTVIVHKLVCVCVYESNVCPPCM